MTTFSYPALAPLPAVVIPIPPPRTVVPTLSVVIVNYRSWSWTARLVAQLRRSRSLRRGHSEIVIVDNHSPFHPLLNRLRRLDGVSLRRWRRNRGFARAVNEGVRLSRGDWVLLLNPDMTVADHFLDQVQKLITRLDREEPRTGIVGLGLRDPDGTPQPSAGPLPSLMGTLFRLLLPRRLRKYDLGDSHDRRGVDWVTGCALLVRRQVLEQLGGFDPEFFLYYEDVDLCRRARQHGWEVRLEPGLAAIHHHPLHGRPVSAYMRLLTRHALLTYAARHWAGWQQRLLARIIRVEARVRGLLARNRGDRQAQHWMTELGHLAREMQHDRVSAARRRLEQAVLHWESTAPSHEPGSIQERMAS